MENINPDCMVSTVLKNGNKFVLVLNLAGTNPSEIETEFPGFSGTVIVDNTMAVGLASNRYCSLEMVDGKVDLKSCSLVDRLTPEIQSFIVSVYAKSSSGEQDVDYVTSSQILTAECKRKYLKEIRSWEF